jgi:hypothetical protein
LRLILEIEIGELLAIGVLHDEGFLAFLDRPGWLEAAGPAAMLSPLALLNCTGVV